MELEHHPCDAHVNNAHLERLVLDGLKLLRSEQPIQELLSAVTRSLREVLGFERGMCYRFDDDNNGEVVAESTAGCEVRSYLGLKFPARDIPRTAREMLVACPIRATFDNSVECHQIVPAQDPGTKHYIDLTYVRSRGAAGSCRNFYLNMGIRSAFVLPIIVDNKLWGLLAFHDQQPKRVHPVFDEYFRAITESLSAAIDTNMRSSREQIRLKSMQVVRDLSAVDPTSEQWLEHVQSRAGQLMELIACTGFILRISGDVFVVGDVPGSEDLSYLLETLNARAQGRPLKVNRLRDLEERLGTLNSLQQGPWLCR